jgi:hypothetical protein
VRVKSLPLMYGAKILKISSCESSGNLIVSFTNAFMFVYHIEILTKDLMKCIVLYYVVYYIKKPPRFILVWS